MTYNVQVGDGGFLGWKLLQRTSERQLEIFKNDKQLQNARDYFSEKLPSIKTAEDLTSDYKMMSVALRAFGLDDDLPNKAFIKKVLEADPDDKDSIVNKLTDKRYLKLNEAFGMGAGSSSSSDKMDASKILDLYVTRSFEKNVGERYSEIELAMNAQRELPSLASGTSSNNTKWYQIIGSKSLMKVFQGAFGLSSTFSQIPVDLQLEELKKRTDTMFGSSDASQFSDTEKLNKLINNYLIKSSIDTQGSSSHYSVALTILRG